MSGEIKGGEVECINDRRDGQNVVRLKEKNVYRYVQKQRKMRKRRRVRREKKKQV